MHIIQGKIFRGVRLGLWLGWASLLGGCSFLIGLAVADPEPPPRTADEWNYAWEWDVKTEQTRKAPPTYAAKAIEAWVVDEETGQPLEGVIITANWELEHWWGHSALGQLTVMEVVTDSKGRFTFPTWGPKPRIPWDGVLRMDDPRLLLFKGGYWGRSLTNTTPDPHAGALRWSDWDGQTIKLKKFEGTLEEYAKSLGSLHNSLRFAFRHKDCSWKQIPRILVALHSAKLEFIAKGLRDSAYFPRSLTQLDGEIGDAGRAACGSVEEFLRSYVP